MIYFKDSSDMREIGSGSVALVVTSPPYPMIKKWDALFGVVDFESQHRSLDGIWEECFRILMDGGIACVNIGDATRSVNKNFCCYPNYARITMRLFSLGFTPLVPILWRKISNRPNAFLGSGFLPPNAYISQDCEYIGIYRKGRVRKFLPKDKSRYSSKYTKDQRDLWFQQAWNIKGQKGAKESSSFPEEIPYRLIRMFSVVGDLVVDPFSGTGTTGRVAESLGRSFVGYELYENEV